MPSVDINWFGVLVAFLVYFVIGAIWFGPKTFYPLWVAALGSDPQASPNSHGPVLTFGLTAVGAFVQVLAVAVVLGVVGADIGPVGGAGTGFLLGIGLVAASSLSHRLFAGQGLRVWLIEAGGDVAGLTAAGAILGAFG